MSILTYEAIAFLQDGSDFSIEAVARRVAEWLPGWKVRQKEKGISICSPGCEFRLHLAEEPWVVEECREMAVIFATCPRSAEIAKCRRWVEVSCADPDPEMVHFNDYVFILQVLEEFQGIILFDPYSGQLI